MKFLLRLPVALIATVSVLAFLLESEAAKPETVAAKPKQVDFARDIYPIFRRSCIECHGPEKQKAELRLDQRVSALESGSIEAGAVFVTDQGVFCRDYQERLVVGGLVGITTNTACRNADGV